MHTLNTRINTAILIVIALTGFAVVAMLASRAYGGPLDPPGPVASTQSNLIFQPASCAGFPIVLSSSGSYKLASNITGCAAKDGIQITASNVTLDLAGFSVLGVPGSGYGIKSVGVVSNLDISRGMVANWGASGVGLYGSAYARIDGMISTFNSIDGFRLGSPSSLAHSTASNNGYSGIRVLNGTFNTTISDCNVDFNNGEAINALGADGITVRDCSAGNNNGGGIFVGKSATIANNHVHHNNGTGIYSDDSCMITGNSSEWNAFAGFQVIGSVACTVTGNKAFANNGDGFSIAPNGGYSWIDSNNASGNRGWGFNVGAANPGYPNIVTRNAASTNLLDGYTVGANNDYAPIVLASAVVNPMSNINN